MTWSEIRNLREAIDVGTPPRDGPLVSVAVDGVAVRVPVGSSVMLAAAEAGRAVPKLCATDMLEPFGSCRICLVEIDGQKGYPASCTTLVAEGMTIRTRSDGLDRLRRGVAELYLSDFPPAELDGGWSEFHDVLRELGVTSHRYGRGASHLAAPVDASNPYFLFDPAKCIVCSRCVRACSDIQGTFALTIAARGFDSKVVASEDKPFFESECVSCGACVQSCPTQALVEKSLFDGEYAHADSTTP
jgi:formate dehydrogenase major subunit